MKPMPCYTFDMFSFHFVKTADKLAYLKRLKEERKWHVEIYISFPQNTMNLMFFIKIQCIFYFSRQSRWASLVSFVNHHITAIHDLVL